VRAGVLTAQPQDCFEIEWRSIVGRQYFVQTATNLLDSWQVVSPVIAASGPLSSFSDCSEQGSATVFYRVVALP